MTTSSIQALTEVARDLSLSLSSERRYKRLLTIAHRFIPYDCAAILRLQGDTLIPVAAIGLSADVMGRRFKVSDHPRLAALIGNKGRLIFPPDSALPDPYDGLVDEEHDELDVHACMGSRLEVNDQIWGIITFDSLAPGRFDDIDPELLEAFAVLAAASANTAAYIETLEDKYAASMALADNLADERNSQQEMIGKSELMQQLNSEINIVARSNFNVLIHGETGTGKELVAHAVHACSDRAHKPMIQLNCAALPESLAESELFGHIKGAFTGAVSNRTGKFALADGGTLFLDEIGELPLPLQAKLLRALQSGEVQRVGEDEVRIYDVRIIAATNRDLQQEVTAGNFRADLFQRLSVYPLHVPPLTQRLADLDGLCGYFLERLSRELGKPQMKLSQAAKQQLTMYHWPGNIRELQHVLSRAVLRAPVSTDKRSTIIEHLDIELQSAPTAVADDFPDVSGMASLSEQTEQFQRSVIRQVLRSHSGNQSMAAKRLGLDRSNFYRLKKRLGL